MATLDPTTARVGDLISIAAATPVVSLTDVDRLRQDLCQGRDAGPALTALLAHYCLDDPDTRAAFEAIVEGLAREEEPGAAFHIQGVYGAGKSHLLAALTLLCGHPEAAWPVFTETHPQYSGLAERPQKRRLIVAIALDEYPTQSHPLEHVVLSRLERELSERHGVRAALTEQSHVLDLVHRYVLPQFGDSLDAAARRACGVDWAELRAGDPERATAVALECVVESSFPLDWRRSRGEAWAELQRALRRVGADGVVVLLDELGIFLAGKDRSGLNADASFLQWLAQRTAAARCWLICVTQRGMEEVGDIDRRTLRQLRDRFRGGFALDLSDLQWVVRHKVAPALDTAGFAAAMEELSDHYRRQAGDEVFSGPALAAAYPINPLCLDALGRAAERCLSRTRSAVRLLREAAVNGGWLSLPAERLITPDVVFDLFREEITMSVAGRRHLSVLEAVVANAGRIARGWEKELEIVTKALCLLGLGELRWSERELRASLVGCEEPDVWRRPEMLRSLLEALYQRGAYIERVRREGEDGHQYFVDISSDAPERIRQRLSELRAQLSLGDSRVLRAALEACREAAFPLAAAAEPRSLAVRWLNARRYVYAVCTDLRDLETSHLQEQAAFLASARSREDGYLFLGSPTVDPHSQQVAWLEAGRLVDRSFGSALAAWLPAALSETVRDQLVEHAALSLMVADRMLFRRGGGEFRDKVRERWSASEAAVRQALQRAYYEGNVIGADGRALIEPQRLWALFGDWEETLSQVFAGPFRALFPRFPSIAPRHQLDSRLHTNQIIDQFVRPGEVALPPASTLEAHLLAYAAPLGLVEGEGRHLRLALKRPELVQAAIAAVPAKAGEEQVDPGETIAVGELAGKLSKSEWGLTREQSELLIAALMRTGHLVGLDAFLQPVRLDQIAAPLGDSLPYVMRGAALRGAAAEAARSLWQAASGEPSGEWSLPVQERAWSFFLEWARCLRERASERTDAITQAARALGHPAEDWDWARGALSRAQALAETVDPARTSNEGLIAAAEAADRPPGGIQRTCKLLSDWRSCARFFETELSHIAKLRVMLAAVELTPRDGLLGREREAVLAHMASSARIVRCAQEVKAAAERWFQRYRRHYLAWHSRAHAAARFESLAALRRSPLIEVARRLARAGIRAEEAAALEAELGTALGRRCLAGDPLPEDCTICPGCGLGFRRELELPEARSLQSRLVELVQTQRSELLSHAALLKRRLVGVSDHGLVQCVTRLLEAHEWGTPENMVALLDDALVTWLGQQIGQPTARRRDLSALEAALRGKELTKQEVLRIAAEWLGAGEDEYVEIV